MPRIRLCGFGLSALAMGNVVAAEEPATSRWVLGLGAAARPHFEGSEGHRVSPAPLIDVQKGRFFARTGEGIGLQFISTPRFTAGLGVNWMQGYDKDDAPRGIGELDDALGGRLFVSTQLGRVRATLAATQALTKNERGMLVNARVSYPLQLTDKLTLVPSLSTNWANDKYMVSYFGVDTVRASTSGLPLFQPSAGFKDVSGRVAANYQLTPHWGLAGAVGVSTLLGDASDSPFIERDSYVSGLLGFTYTF